MQRLSSRMTFFYKRVFPVIWFGFLALFVAGPFLAPAVGGSVSGPPPVFLLFGFAMAIFSFFIMKKLIFDLVDEVLDAGDALVIRNGDREERVALSDIVNVSYAQLTNPPRVTLSLRNPTQFGDRVTFCAPVRLSPLAAFSPNPIIDELIQRVDAARQRGRR